MEAALYGGFTADGTIGVVKWEYCKAVDRHPDKLGGAWCFAGTRLQVLSLFEHLDQGATVDEFLEWFPEVTAEQEHAVLDFAKSSLKQPSAVA